jgi:hypothetical protein
VAALARELAPFAPGGAELAEKVGRVLAEMGAAQGVESPAPLVALEDAGEEAETESSRAERYRSGSLPIAVASATGHQEIVFEPLFEDDVCSFYKWRSLAVLCWWQTPTVLSNAGMTTAVLQIVRRESRSFVLCSMIAASAAAPPDAEARAAVQRSIKQFEPHMAGLVNVVFGTGFQAATIRAIVGGLLFALRHPFPTAVVADEHAAALFILRQWPAEDEPAPAAAALEAALRQVAPV